MKVTCFGLVGLFSLMLSASAQIIDLPAPPLLIWNSPALNAPAPRDATVRFSIVADATGLAADTLAMYLNGVNVTTNAVIDHTPAVSTITYQHPSLYPVGSTQTVRLEYADTGIIPALFTNEFAFVTAETADPLYDEANFFIEAEDFNFDGGFYLTNSMLRGAMANIGGLVGIDFYRFPRGADLDNYRKNEGPGVNVKMLPATSDGPRLRLQGRTDYKVVGVEENDWFSYTRIFPTNEYNVYVRFASQARMRSELHKVVEGRTTTDQTIESLGAFDMPRSGSTNTYVFAPLRVSGTNAVLTLGGETTLRFTTLAANIDYQYLMFVPLLIEPAKLSVAKAEDKLSISWAPPGGRLESALDLAGPWTNAGTTNPAAVPITAEGNQFFRVARP